MAAMLEDIMVARAPGKISVKRDMEVTIVNSKVRKAINSPTKARDRVCAIRGSIT
jgi:hypothetical protein